jgi:hypothetical protein
LRIINHSTSMNLGTFRPQWFQYWPILHKAPSLHSLIVVHHQLIHTEGDFNSWELCEAARILTTKPLPHSHTQSSLEKQPMHNPIY